MHKIKKDKIYITKEDNIKKNITKEDKNNNEFINNINNINNI